VFQNGVLRKIFRPKWDELTWKWRKLHNEELNVLYCSPNIIDKIENNVMGGACSTYRGEETCIQGFGEET
jgi:hypothetical protein